MTEIATPKEALSEAPPGQASAVASIPDFVEKKRRPRPESVESKERS